MDDELIPLPPSPPRAKVRNPLTAHRRDAPLAQEFSRAQAVDNIQRTFDLIGGVDRMALWANQEPGKFFTQVYPKLLPSTSLNINGDNTKVEIVHSLPATKLDEHEN